MVDIPPLTALQRVQFVPNVREARHNVRVRLPLDVFGVLQHLPNDYSDNGRVYHEYLLDRLLAGFFLDKIRSLLVLLNLPRREYIIRTILKYASDVP